MHATGPTHRHEATSTLQHCGHAGHSMMQQSMMQMAAYWLSGRSPLCNTLLPATQANHQAIKPTVLPTHDHTMPARKSM